MPSFPTLLRSSALLGSIALVLAFSPRMVRADLLFEQPSVDVGDVRAGVPLSHRFQFVNRGHETVEVIDARASCGCLTPRMGRRVYKPGERGSLLLEVNTLNQSPGFQAWRVQLCCQTGSSVREVFLRMTGRIITEITVRPAALTVYADSAVGHELVLTDLRPLPLAIADIRTSSPRLRARLTAKYQDSSGHLARKIGLEVAGDYPEGRHDETVSIYTDDPAYRELRVPVTIVKRSRQQLIARPSQVTLLAPPGQPAPSRIVLLQAHDDQPVAIQSVDTDDQAVKCRWARGPGTMATLKITVDRTRVHGTTLKTVVRVHVSKPMPQDVAIPVFCTLQ